MAVAILLLVISCGAVAAGWGQLRAARRARSYATTRGSVTGREIASVPGPGSREGRWGRGGGYRPKVTYSYVVDGITYTSDGWSYAIEGLKRSVAEAELAAVPDDVEVHCDPRSPQDAYLQVPESRLGYWLVAGGVLGVMISAAMLLA